MKRPWCWWCPPSPPPRRMSRYLTPSKIALLALISLYTESVIPLAATIPVLSFLVSHILPVSSAASQERPATHTREIALVIDNFQKALISHVSGIPGRTVWDLLLQKLWKINSIDALHAFFDALSLLLQKTPEEQQNEVEDGIDPNPNRMLLSRTSPLGSFVRRAQLEFTRLQFHDGVSLWKSFITYRTPTFTQWKRRNLTAGNASFDVNLQEDHLELGNRLIDVVYGDSGNLARQEASVSVDDVETLLGYQVDQMQSRWIPRAQASPKDTLNKS